MAFYLLPLADVEVGGYLSIWKILPVLFILLIWMKLLTWVDKDAEAAYLPREPINGGLIGGAVAAFALFFILPNFWIGLAAVVFLFLAEIGTYLVIRNKKVGLADLKGEMKNLFTNKKKEKAAKTVEGAVALLTAKGNVITPPEPENPDAPAYLAVQQMFTDPLVRKAERIDMAPAEGVAQVRYQVDGVTYNAPSLDVASSQAGVNYLKRLIGLDANERRKPQKGKMKVALGGTRHEMEVHTAGNAAGEFLKVFIDPKNFHAFRLENLGLLEEQFAKIKAVVGEPSGIVLLSAPKGQGLTSLCYAILRAHDAFLTHIHTVERAPDQDIEGITQNALAANAGPDEEFKQLDWVISQEPDVIMVPSVENPKSAVALAHFAAQGKRVYAGVRAGSTFQALDMWRKLVGDDTLAMKDLSMVISGRVMRRLCNACKVGYAPDPDTVRKLNLDPARVGKLFQARTQPMRDEKGNVIPCDFCKELRYKGRFGVYELLDVDPDVKQIVGAGGSVNQLKAVFRKQRARFLQEVGLFQVSEGETSIQEMLRVLRADQGPSAPPAGGAPGGGRALPAAGPRPPGAGPKAPGRPPAHPPAR